jgi:hypothetical protein
VDDDDGSVTATADIEPTAGARLLRVTDTAAQAISARLCYGDAVQHGERTVISVASVLKAGAGLREVPRRRTSARALSGLRVDGHWFPWS